MTEIDRLIADKYKLLDKYKTARVLTSTFKAEDDLYIHEIAKLEKQIKDLVRIKEGE